MQFSMPRYKHGSEWRPARNTESQWLKWKYRSWPSQHMKQRDRGAVNKIKWIPSRTSDQCKWLPWSQSTGTGSPGHTQWQSWGAVTRSMEVKAAAQYLMQMINMCLFRAIPTGFWSVEPFFLPSLISWNVTCDSRINTVHAAKDLHSAHYSRCTKLSVRQLGLGLPNNPNKKKKVWQSSPRKERQNASLIDQEPGLKMQKTIHKWLTSALALMISKTCLEIIGDGFLFLGLI